MKIEQEIREELAKTKQGLLDTILKNDYWDDVTIAKYKIWIKAYEWVLDENKD